MNGQDRPIENLVESVTLQTSDRLCDGPTCLYSKFDILCQILMDKSCIVKLSCADVKATRNPLVRSGNGIETFEGERHAQDKMQVTVPSGGNLKVIMTIRAKEKERF